MDSTEEQTVFNAPDILNRMQTDYLAVSQHITYLTNKNRHLENENNSLKLRVTDLEKEVNKKDEIISSMNKRGLKRKREAEIDQAFEVFDNRINMGGGEVLKLLRKQGV